MTTTLHTDKNFDPANYVVAEYIDTKLPAPEEGYYWNPVKEWEKGMETLFGDNWAGKYNYCAHCHRWLRYVAVVTYLPTGENLAFGMDCVELLNFANVDELKKARMLRKAKLDDERAENHRKYLAFLKAHLEVEALVRKYDENKDKFFNGFLADVRENIQRYMNPTEKMLTAFERVLNEEIEKANRPVEPEKVRNYVGNVGEKLTLTVKVLGKGYVETMYGTNVLYVFEDEAGNKLTTFYAGHAMILEKNGTYNIKGTVKKHEVYKDEKQTVLTRVALVK